MHYYEVHSEFKNHFVVVPSQRFYTIVHIRASYPLLKFWPNISFNVIVEGPKPSDCDVCWNSSTWVMMKLWWQWYQKHCAAACLQAASSIEIGIHQPDFKMHNKCLNMVTVISETSWNQCSAFSCQKTKLPCLTGFSWKRHLLSSLA